MAFRTSPSDEDGPPERVHVRAVAEASRDAYLAAVTDIPVQVPVDALPLAQAGVCEQHVEFTVPSFVDGTSALTVTGTLTASAALPATQRGVHMSRIVTSIASMSGHRHASFNAFLERAARDVAAAQGLTIADVSFSGATTAERVTVVTGRASPDRFGVFGSAHLDDGTVSMRVGLRAAVMTACPCTQAYTWHSTVLALADRFGTDIADAVGEYFVGYTHSQRGNLEADVESDDSAALSWLYAAMESGAQLTYELLKRPDEHELVQRAHGRPQFTEDVARAVAAALLRSAPLDPLGDLVVTCRNVESIHAHDVYAVVRGKVGVLAAALRSTVPPA
jgi:GTP cyclohydrolase FolE2